MKEIEAEVRGQLLRLLCKASHRIESLSSRFEWENTELVQALDRDIELDFD